MKDYDEILYVMAKGYFKEIHFFILKQKKLYLECLNLLFDGEVKINKKDETIFTFINMTLTRLQIKKQIQEYKKFKAEVKKNLIKISEKSIENCYTIINLWFKKDKKECLEQLKHNPKLQLKYIEYSVNKMIKDKDNNEIEYEENDSYMNYLLERHVYLLCAQNRKNEVIHWLKKLDNYPIKECVQICEKNKVYDALIFLYKKEGNIDEELQVYYEMINNIFNEILIILKDKEWKENLYMAKKDEFIKLIDNTIETIELEEKENENVKLRKDEEHKFWKDILSNLYRIQEKYSKEPKNQEEKKEIYSDISDLLLTQIQKLITRMASFVGKQDVFDFMLKVKSKG